MSELPDHPAIREAVVAMSHKLMEVGEREEYKVADVLEAAWPHLERYFLERRRPSDPRTGPGFDA